MATEPIYLVQEEGPEWSSVIAACRSAKSADAIVKRRNKELAASPSPLLRNSQCRVKPIELQD